MNAHTDIIESNLCDFEHSVTLTGDNVEEDGMMGFNVRFENGSYWATLAWFPLGNARLSRDIAVAAFGEAAVRKVESVASEYYEETCQ